MGTVYMNGQSTNHGSEDSCLQSNASELDCCKSPLIFKVNLPFTDYLSFVDYIRFLRASKHLGWHQTDLIEDRISDAPGPFCRTTSLSEDQVKLRFSGCLAENLRCYRRSRSTNDLYDFFLEYALDSFKDGSVSRLSTIPVKISGLTSCQHMACNASPTASNSEVMALNSPLLESSTNSTGSYQSNPSPCPSVSKGLLRGVWNNDSLTLLFSEDDNCGKLYVASCYKLDSSIGQPLDYIYLFHSRTGNQASEFLGKMKVFTSVTLHPNRPKLAETEFVLFGAQGDRSREVHGSPSGTKKRKGFSEKVIDMFWPNHSSKHKSTCHTGEKGLAGTTLQDLCVDEATDYSEFVKHLNDGFKNHLELATIVGRSSQQDGNKEAAVGGWGLKFLDEVIKDPPSLHPDICSGSHVQDRWPPRRSMNVLVAADVHGGAITGNIGPSSLTERWQTGHCDCGGWDLGCPLTVLHDSKSVCSEDFLMEDTQENCKSVDLFTEGTRHGEPRLRMVNMSEGLYTVHFQRTLSALQAFAVGVAVVHSQTPAFCPHL
ncbi:Uncharacterized protein M6B38_245555 [Iris pallida]|uniref:Uncharacterized protein n=1 Tax=Iris pallida TaxID=29817 RepID=A0AAX6DH58_IRIPA|nr:Uncharacterized protein M6B38_245555 [Iris pallida]